MAAKIVNTISANSLADLITNTNTFLAANATYIAVGGPVFETSTGKWHWGVSST